MCVIILAVVGLLYMIHRDSKLVCKMEEDHREHDNEEYEE